MAESDLSGVWHSSYEYGEGRIGEHEISVSRKTRDKYTGVSEEDETGNVLRLNFRFRWPRTLSGEFLEKTSSAGEYKGHIFQGLVMFILNLELTEASGYWIGDNRDQTHVNHGAWVLTREKE